MFRILIYYGQGAKENAGKRRTAEKKLHVLGLPKRVIYQQKTKNTVSYMFKYSHRDSVKLFHLFYEKSKQNSLFLKRKYDIFLLGIKAERNL